MHQLELVAEPQVSAYPEIPLTQNKVALVDLDDFDYLMQWNWFAHLDKSTGRYYAGRNVPAGSKKQRYLSMHRFLMGEPIGYKVDHADRNGLNNQRDNLRVATNQQNGCNSGMQSNNTSGYRGVYLRRDSGKWGAYVILAQKQVHLGFFPNAVDAAVARDAMALKLHGEFVVLNFPLQEAG